MVVSNWAMRTSCLVPSSAGIFLASYCYFLGNQLVIRWHEIVFFSVENHCLSFRKRHCLRWTISSNWWASSNVWSMACRWSWWARRAVAKRRWHLGWRKVPLECYHSGWDKSWRQAHLEMMVKPYDFTIFVVNHPNVFFFLRLSRGVPMKKLPSSRLVWKAGEVPGGDAELLPFYFGHSRRYHGCGKLRTRVGLVERRHLCDTRKGWDVRCEVRGDEDGTRMRWDEMKWDVMLGRMKTWKHGMWHPTSSQWGWFSTIHYDVSYGNHYI